MRSNSNALRYRLHHKEDLLNLISDINGLIRNSNRLVQLNKICIKYALNFILPEKLTYDNGWFSGFFDACGDLNIQLDPPVEIGLTRSPRENKGERLVDDNKSQLIVSLIHENYNLVVLYKDIFGRDINFDRNRRYV